MTLCVCVRVRACMQHKKEFGSELTKSTLHILLLCSNSIVCGSDGTLRVGYLASRLCPLSNVRTVPVSAVCMLQSTSWEAHTSSVGQDKPHVFRKLYPPRVSDMNQTIRCNPILSSLYKAHCNVALLSTLPHPLELPRCDTCTPRCVAREVQLWSHDVCNFLQFLVMSFLFLSLRRVLNVICFFLGNSPAFEF